MTNVQTNKQDKDDQPKVVQRNPDQATTAREIERTSLKKKTRFEWIQRIIGALFLMGLIIMLILFFTYDHFQIYQVWGKLSS